MRATEFITEAVKQRLDPKCWKGKHKEGTKIKGGVRVNNCVPNESVAEGMEPIGGPWKSGEFSRILNAFQVYTNTMGYGMEFYNWANRPQALKLLADKSGTTPDLVKHTLDSLNWGQHPEEKFDDEEQDVAEGTTPVDYTKFKLSRSGGEEEKYTVFNLFYNDKFVGDIGYLKADQNWFVGEPSGSAWGALNGKYHDNNRYATKDQALQALIKAVEPHLNLVAEGSVKDINDIVEKYCAQQGITRRDLTNYDVKQLSKLSGLPTYYIRDQLIKTSPGVTEGEVVPFRRPQAQPSLPADILHLANEWFHANDDTNTLQAVTDQDYGQGADNLVKYIQAKLQSKGWTIDFDDEIDNIVLRNRLGQTVSLPVNDAYNETGWAKELAEEFDLIESVIENLAKHNGVNAEVIWEDLESLTDDELYVFATTTTIMETEAWQKTNKRDKTDGMSKKAVKTYRREHPGSKLQTAVTTKPSKLKKGSKASKRRKSYCSRSRGQMKMHNISCAKTPDKAICKARRRWNC